MSRIAKVDERDRKLFLLQLFVSKLLERFSGGFINKDCKVRAGAFAEV
jgi:hypothetical protein